MPRPLVVIFHQPPRADDPPLTGLLAESRDRLVERHAALFARAGAHRLLVVPGRPEAATESFGERLARIVAEEDPVGGLVVLGSGAVPMLRRDDATRLLGVAAGGGRRALTNNRYSSDVCALSDAGVLRGLPPLPSDNALPRWLEEKGGVRVTELPGRDRLALDLDTPLDLALLAQVIGAPRSLRDLASRGGLGVPRLAELRALAADPRKELLVFGRSGSRTLRWLERNVRCRVRFLAEERGLRASSPLAIHAGAAIAGGARAPVPVSRPPRATLGRLLDSRGPGALAAVVADLADGAIIDSRVLMADRLGADEASWPVPEDRFASDLLRTGDVSDPWLRAVTASAAELPLPILLGAHSVVGPGIPILLRAAARRRRGANGHAS